MTTNSRNLRKTLAAGCAVMAIGWAGQASAQDAREYSIGGQSLDEALRTFAMESGHDVAFAPDLVRGKQTEGVQGRLTDEAALAILLAQSGLRFEQTSSGGFVVVGAGGRSGPQFARAEEGGAGTVDALVVTAQKKEEAIQDVPIAISAFSQQSLDAQKLEGGFDLLKAIPNVTFSKNNFSGYNFSIRGIGTKAISATTDPGVAVAFNNTTLIINRLFGQEYFDVERVEVLRGPQGTLYGRNATSGVINVLSARPRLGEFEAEIKLETGNYKAKRARGMINVPVGDTLAVRLAGAMTIRDGYGVNLAADDPNTVDPVSRDVDDRNLWSGRVTVGWEPIEQVRANLLWEHFEEDDQRVRTSKQLCHNDPGPATVGAFEWSKINNPAANIFRGLTSQGCKAGSLYDDAAYGTPNGASLPPITGLFIGNSLGMAMGGYGLGFNRYFFENITNGPLAGQAPCPAMLSFQGTFPISLCNTDPYRGLTQSRDLRTIHSLLEPIYQASADTYELTVDVDVTDSLSFTSQTVYNRDEYYATQDFNRFTTHPILEDSAIACDPVTVFASLECNPGTYLGGFYNVTPDGIFTDPQLGPSRTLVAQDLAESESEQFNQEFRLASNFDADVNFSLGANFTHFETIIDYYIFANLLTLASHFFPWNPHTGGLCYNTTGVPAGSGPIAPPCIYVDPNPLESINGEGHNYFRSANPYKLTSSGLFGEIYWQATETLRVTAGARMSWDRKVFTPIPSQLLLWDYRQLVPEGAGPEDCAISTSCQMAGTGQNLGEGARGSPANPDIVQEWREPTGRLVVDWKPELGFTDESMFYASVSHGYKGGGANPPGIAPPAGIHNQRNTTGAAPPTFEPEYIDAFELGTKNTLLGGGLILNGNVFYYDYTGYQISKIVDRSAANENFDAKLWGVELEWVFSPTRDFRLNGTFGYLHTQIGKGETSIDLMDRADGGNTPWTTADGYVYTEWMVMKPWIVSSSNCVVPKAVVEGMGRAGDIGNLIGLCPGGGLGGNSAYRNTPVPFLGRPYNPATDAPNGGSGFSKDIGGNELPNAPHFTANVGAQYRLPLPGGWDATIRGDYYWQSQSFARVYNTRYDRLRAWTNTNISLWVENPDWGVKAEVYVKNVFDETPITDTFLNSDDAALTTNVFTLDPRLIGVSVTKSF